MRELPTLVPDELVTPVVGDWAHDKYRLFWCYADIFSTSMKDKWKRLVYVDLFAGPGRAQIRGSKRVVPAPPLLALELRFPFTRYIFSEFKKEKLEALRTRVERAAPDADVHFVLGDTNANIDKIIELIPNPSRNETVLTFCFADPYRLADLPFSTLAKLAKARFTDFLVLVPSGMDASRNRKTYLSAKSRILDAFLSDTRWRERWQHRPVTNQPFTEFVVDEFGRSMTALDYRYNGIGSAHPMRSTKKNLLIYHLLMLSKHGLGGDFWDKCRESSSPQRTLF